MDFREIQIIASVNDEHFDKLVITGHLKDGVKITDLKHSFELEALVLHNLANSFPAICKYYESEINKFKGTVVPK